jgi:hypothetical protein
MYRCLLINRWWQADNPLERYILRTGCLDLVWAGAYSDEALHRLRTDMYDLVFISLPTPEHVIPEPFLFELRKQPALIATALYPASVFDSYSLHPLFFLEEPFSLAQFEHSINLYLLETK